MGWAEQTTQPEGINGERRLGRRYGIALELRWKLVRRRRVLESGTGTTLDLSSGGILFDGGRPLPVGLNVELSIAWPALLHDVAPMQLVVTGRIVRTHGTRTGIHMTGHEFRTIGGSAERRNAIAAGLGRPATLYTPPALANKFETLQ